MAAARPAPPTVTDRSRRPPAPRRCRRPGSCQPAPGTCCARTAMTAWTSAATCAGTAAASAAALTRSGPPSRRRTTRTRREIIPRSREEGAMKIVQVTCTWKSTHAVEVPDDFTYTGCLEDFPAQALEEMTPAAAELTDWAVRERRPGWAPVLYPAR